MPPLLSSGGGSLKIPPPKPSTAGLPRIGAGIGGTTRGIGTSFAKAARTVSGATKTVKTTVPKVATPKVTHPKVVAAKAPVPDAALNALVSSMLTPATPQAAQSAVDAIYAPIRAQYQQQIAQTAAQAQARAAQMQQVYGAFAQYLSGGPAQIAAIYNRGQTDGTALMQGMAGPQGAVGSHLAANAAINSNLMSQESANWQAYASQQPRIYSLTATQNVLNMLNAAGDSETQLRSKLLDLSSQEASAVLNYLQQARAQDNSIRQWGFGQAQAEANARATAAYNAAKLKQTAQSTAFNQKLLADKFGLAQTSENNKVAYQNLLLAYKKAGIISQDKYRQAMVQVAQNKFDLAKWSAQQKAQTDATKAATANAKQVQTNQASLNKSLHALTQSVTSWQGKSAPGGGTASRTRSIPVYEKDPKTGKVMRDKNGRPIIVSHNTVRTSSGTGPAYNTQQIWNLAWGNYARPLFAAYRTIYPNEAGIPGRIEARVENAIASAVGWRPPTT